MDDILRRVREGIELAEDLYGSAGDGINVDLTAADARTLLAGVALLRAVRDAAERFIAALDRTDGDEFCIPFPHPNELVAALARVRGAADVPPGDR